MKSSTLATALALALAGGALVATAALAQGTNTARPAAKPPATGGNTLALGGGGTGGARKPILTRDELRACLDTEADVRTRISGHEAARAPLDEERKQIGVEQEALKADRALVDEAVARAEAFKAKMAAHAERVKVWNEEVSKFNDRPPTGSAGERTRVRINQEREALQKAQGELETERVQVQSSSQAAVDAYNAKSKVLQDRIAGWNQRNSEWNEAGRKLEADRLAWVGECSDRRYREEDELAIKAGR
jgi:hypothetical protein